ncbi:MAG: glycosyl hydrolase [Dechloromonas sp.]|uniref:WD40/YVTN/BNR-like repeat-containing protein n=1 Tax=Dechloromonas sp. TaxID=1917218 RepID=UPI0027F168F6|nr:YCF48-related protein [Dechloromonas sp.]MBT9520209.1 glycosyl hydrolase [Dechloromonas sp.]
MLPRFENFDSQARVGVTIATSLIPIAVIGALLYAAFFVKATAEVSSVKPPEIERRDRFLGVAMPTENVIWAAGSNGKVVRSDDAGKTWAAQSIPTVENLQGIAAWDVNRAIAVGGNGVLIQTDDAGKTWREIQVPKSEVANKLLSVRAYDNGKAWAVGELGAALQTLDFGHTWKRVFPEKDQAWNDVSFSGNFGLMVGEFGQAMKTADGGATWQAASSGVQSSLMSVYLRDELNGVAVGLSGVILVTRDGGRQWASVERQTREHLNNVIWDGAQWVAVGDKGVIVIGDADGRIWKASRVSEGNLGWNTQVLRVPSSGKANNYVLAGASLALLTPDRLTVYGRSAD